MSNSPYPISMAEPRKHISAACISDLTFFFFFFAIIHGSRALVRVLINSPREQWYPGNNMLSNRKDVQQSLVWEMTGNCWAATSIWLFPAEADLWDPEGHRSFSLVSQLNRFCLKLILPIRMYCSHIPKCIYLAHIYSFLHIFIECIFRI